MDSVTKSEFAFRHAKTEVFKTTKRIRKTLKEMEVLLSWDCTDAAKQCYFYLDRDTDFLENLLKDLNSMEKTF